MIKKFEDIKKRMRNIIAVLVASLIIGILTFYFTRNGISSVVALISIIILSFLFLFIQGKLKAAAEIKKLEAAFPDFLSLMASNLRAGITVDRALLLSAREELAPLDKEINQLGKDLVTGRDIEKALKDMALRMKSEKLQKTIMLLVTGIRSGGNLAVLLQDTATSMKERNFVEKRAASNVLMYVILIFFAMAVGAPMLFALSNVLTEVLSNILTSIPPAEAQAQTQLPFTLTQVNISPTFIFYFSIAFLIVINILGSLVLGIVSKGSEREGIKYIVPITAISIVVFLAVRLSLLSYFSGFFG